MYSQADIRDFAHDVVDNAKQLFTKASDESSHTAKEMRKQLRRYYPTLVHNVKHTRNDAMKHVHNFSVPAKYKVRHFASRMGRDLHFAESCLIHLGLGYVLVKIYKACSHETAPASARIKMHIQQKPVESALIALGAGYLLAKILR